MRRLAVIIGALIVLVTAAFLLAPLFVSDELAKARVTEQITQWIGRPVSFTGEPEVSLFPRPKVVLHDVVIEDDDGSGLPFIEVEELAGSIRLLPLLAGRVEVGSFDLIRPTISLRLDETGNSNWWFEGGSLGERLTAAFDEADEDGNGPPEEVVLGAIRIREGTITYEEPGLGPAMLTDVSLDLSWPKTSRAATAEGSVVWHDERLDVSAILADPLELIAGRNAPMRFTIAGAPIRIAFDGEIGRADLEFAFDGDVEVTMDSLRDVVRWAGTPMAEGTTLGAAAISGQVSWSWPVLAFTASQMRLDGNAANGALSVNFGGDRYGIDGTFAAGQLDISPYTNSFRADLPAGGEWAEAEIALPVLDTLDADIRVSADRLQIGTAHLDAFAGSLIVSEGQISLNLGQSDFYGGTIDVNVSGDYQAPHLAVAAHVAVDGVAARPALTDIFGVSAVDGVAGGTLDVAGAGDTWGEIIESLDGGVEAEIVDGFVRGLDLERVAAMAEPTVEAIGVDGAETSYARIGAALVFADGRLAAEAIEAEGRSFAASFTGWGSLTSSEIGGEGTVYLGADERPLPFRLVGSWLEPRFVDVALP